MQNNTRQTTEKTKGADLFDYYGFTRRDAKKYPVISGILRELTPERIEKEIKEIQKVKLPPELQKWVKEYEKVGGRNNIIWLLTYRIIQKATFSIVEKKYLKSLQSIKLLISMFIILVDDIVDDKKNKRLLNECYKIPWGKDYTNLKNLSLSEREYFELVVELWGYINESITKYPKYEEFKNIFRYDIVQILNSMNFALLVNENHYLINKNEYWLYFPNSMQGMAYTTLDLMCSSKFKINKSGVLREISSKAQNMVRIGNWLSTWEIETYKNDFTSGIIAYALDHHIISINKLRNRNKLELIKKIKDSQIEKGFLKEWESYYYEVQIIGKKLKEIKIKDFISALEELLILDLSYKKIIQIFSKKTK